jgi:ABC-type nitrate/sulfonate/bicarbonate transport system substrate-binding protein
MLLLFLALLISSLVPAPGRGAEPPSKAGFAYGAINAYMAKLNIPFQATGMVTTRKILKSNEQMVERVARANVDAVNYIRSPENKKSVLQTMSKNFKVANPERIEAAYRDIVEELPRNICPTMPGVRSVLKLMVELGINLKASQVKTKEVVDFALCKRLGGDGGS